MPSRSSLVVVAILVVLIALVLAWSLTPLGRILEPGVVLAYRERIRSLPFAPLLAILAIVAGGLVSAPATLMIAATSLVFGPWRGPLYAMVGLLVSAAVTCVAVRHVARDAVDRWLLARRGSWVASFGRAIERHGVLAIMLMRFTPTPFLLQNLVIGVARVELSKILLGTAIGVVPAIAVMTFVATQVDAMLVQPNGFPLLLTGVAVALVGVFWLLQRWAARRTGDR